MIITNVFGGLGNQMFQYAAGRSLALRTGSELRLDYGDWGANRHAQHNGFELPRIFSLPTELASAEESKKVLGLQANFYLRRIFKNRRMAKLRTRSFVVEPHYHYWPEFERIGAPAYLHGFWQSERYFDEVSDRIRADFAFKEPDSDENRAWLSKMRSTRSVSLHVRRGDYVSNTAASQYHGTCSPAYYSAAVDYIARREPDAELFVFSDDIEWARSNLDLKLPAHYIFNNSGPSSYVDMQLMSNCAHNIIANSSFSWWGAWLNFNKDKIVVSPSRWFADQRVQAGDLYPPGFVRI